MTAPHRVARTIGRLAALALLASACAASPPPRQQVRVRPATAVTHARGDQIAMVASLGAPDVVRVFPPSGVSRWVYCGADGEWSRVVDFDAVGNVLVSLELPEPEGAECAKRP
jgi:hypothetical protein